MGIRMNLGLNIVMKLPVIFVSKVEQAFIVRFK